MLKTNSPYPPYQQLAPPGTAPYQQSQPPPSYTNPPPPSQNLESLHRDIEGLINAATEEFGGNLYDTAIQTRLKALIDLRNILRTQQLLPDQIQAIRNQVNLLQAAKAPPAPAPLVPTPQPAPMIASTPPVSLPYSPPVQIPYQAPPLPPQAAPALPPTNYLASLLASVERSKSAQPINTYTPPPISTPSVDAQISAAPTENPLLARLRASGLIGGSSVTPLNGLPILPQPLSQTSQHPPLTQTPINLAELLKIPPPMKQEKIDFTPASLKQ